MDMPTLKPFDTYYLTNGERVLAIYSVNTTVLFIIFFLIHVLCLLTIKSDYNS